METNYGVGISNRYDLFLDEDADPLEILKLQEEERLKAAAKKEKVPVKDTKSKSTKAAPKKNDEPKKAPRPVAALSESNRGDLNTANSKPNKPRSEFNNVRRDENHSFSVPVRYDGVGRDNRDDAPSGPGNRGGRGGGGFRGGRGGFRPRGRGGSFDVTGRDQRGKREYERHSGTDRTGIKSVDKRDGGGAHNWGRATDAYENTDWTQPAEDAAPGTAEPESPPKTENAAAIEEGKETENAETKEAGAGGDEEGAEIKEEPQEKQFTLDEWKALQAEKRNRPQYNLRRAGEGEDPKQWKNTVVLKKKEPISDEEEEDDDEEEEEEDDANNRQSLANLIPIVFSSGPARRGGRGGPGGRGGRGRGGAPPMERGGGRFGGPRGGGGGERSGRGGPGGGGQQSAPKVDDENDFPSL